MGRSESAAKDVQRQRKEEETPEEVAVGWAGLDPSKDKDLGCALSLEHIAETSPATAVPEIASRGSHTTLQWD